MTSSIYKATLHPSGKTFNVLPRQSLLEAGLGAGIALPFGCANGSCGDCRARILSGEVQRIKDHDYSLTEVQKLEGYCLLCSSTALNDIDMEVHDATSVDDVPLQHLQAKLCRLEVNSTVTVATFKFSRGKALRFLPGQSATLTLSEGETITLPIASCPCNAEVVEFHLNDNPGTNKPVAAPIIERIVQLAETRQRVAISGPVGEFTLNTPDNRPAIFFAQGSDFAQLQGMIEQVLSSEVETPCCLVWISAEHTGHYRSNLCRSWRDAMDRFSFVPVAPGSDSLAALPTEWQDLLSHGDVYLGRHDQELIDRLMVQGVAAGNIHYP